MYELFGIGEEQLMKEALQMNEFNQDLLLYILDELMPWHYKPQLRDFSLLEVNRYFIVMVDF